MCAIIIELKMHSVDNVFIDFLKDYLFSPVKLHVRYRQNPHYSF